MKHESGTLFLGRTCLKREIRHSHFENVQRKYYNNTSFWFEIKTIFRQLKKDQIENRKTNFIFFQIELKIVNVESFVNC